jgi:hypothetical protein
MRDDMVNVRCALRSMSRPTIHCVCVLELGRTAVYIALPDELAGREGNGTAGDVSTNIYRADMHPTQPVELVHTGLSVFFWKRKARARAHARANALSVVVKGLACE